MPSAGLKTIILLSFVLAISFLLVVLSCALYSNWLPLLVATLFTFAPLPNFIASRCSSAYDGDFSNEDDYTNGVIDLGRFFTAIFLCSGIALPFVLAHAGIIANLAGWMSAAGGLIGYGTIITYAHFFNLQVDEY